MDLTFALAMVFTLLAGFALGIAIAALRRRPLRRAVPGGILHIHLSLKVLDRIATAPGLSASDVLHVDAFKQYFVAATRLRVSPERVSAMDAERVIYTFHCLALTYAGQSLTEMQFTCNGKHLHCNVSELVRACQEMLREAIDENRTVASMRVGADAEAGYLQIRVQLLPVERPGAGSDVRLERICGSLS